MRTLVDDGMPPRVDDPVDSQISSVKVQHGPVMVIVKITDIRHVRLVAFAFFLKLDDFDTFAIIIDTFDVIQSGVFCINLFLFAAAYRCDNCSARSTQRIVEYSY